MKKSDYLIGCAVIAFGILAIDAWVTTHSMFDAAIRMVEIEAKINVVELVAKTNASRLDGRSEFMSEVSAAIETKTQDRYTLKDQNKWIAEVNKIWLFRWTGVRLPNAESSGSTTIIDVPD